MALQFNILIVDDSAVMRAMILKTLRLTGLPLGDVHQAANGAEGFACARTNWVDLILADINMPVMTGVEMIEKLRETPETRDIPIIVVSTESSDTRIQWLAERGVAFVHKPFTPERLRETVLSVTGVSDDQLVADVSVAGGDQDF
jgi:two-component system chemotaxis response regulator CheY